MKNTHLITLLNDGETWTNTVGTKVMVLPEESFKAVMEDDVSPESVTHLHSFDLFNPAHLRSLALFIETGRR